MQHYYQGKFNPINKKKYKGDLNNIWYRSSWECKMCSWLDRTPEVLQWSNEETIIPYISPVDNRVHRYFPDFLYVIQTNKGIETRLCEVKPKAQTKPPKTPKRKTQKYLKEIATYSVNSAKWLAAQQYCAKMGYIFEIITEKELGITWH